MANYYGYLTCDNLSVHECSTYTCPVLCTSFDMYTTHLHLYVLNLVSNVEIKLYYIIVFAFHLVNDGPTSFPIYMSSYVNQCSLTYMYTVSSVNQEGLPKKFHFNLLKSVTQYFILCYMYIHCNYSCWKIISMIDISLHITKEKPFWTCCVEPGGGGYSL